MYMYVSRHFLQREGASSSRHEKCHCATFSKNCIFITVSMLRLKSSNDNLYSARMKPAGLHKAQCSR